MAGEKENTVPKEKSLDSEKERIETPMSPEGGDWVDKETEQETLGDTGMKTKKSKQHAVQTGPVRDCLNRMAKAKKQPVLESNPPRIVLQRQFGRTDLSVPAESGTDGSVWTIVAPKVQAHGPGAV